MREWRKREWLTRRMSSASSANRSATLPIVRASPDLVPAPVLPVLKQSTLCTVFTHASLSSQCISYCRWPKSIAILSIRPFEYWGMKAKNYDKNCVSNHYWCLIQFARYVNCKLMKFWHVLDFILKLQRVLDMYKQFYKSSPASVGKTIESFM